MINEILEFSKLLCVKTEPTWLRRNSNFYDLISCVNNLTSLFIGEQYTDVALFIKRIDAELSCLEMEHGYRYEYFEIVKKYMQRIVECLLLNNLLSEVAMSSLPENYQNTINTDIINNENQLSVASQILFNNYQCGEGSFIYYLHEESTFDEQSFWKYYNSIVQIIKIKIGMPKNEKITTALVLTHTKIMEYFLWHLAENDMYVMKNYPTNTIQLYVERLFLLIDGYLKGYVIDETILGDELKNPMLSL